MPTWSQLTSQYQTDMQVEKPPGYRYRFASVGAGRTGSPKAPSSLTNPLTKYSYEARKKQPLVQCKLDATRGIHVSRNEALQRQTGA